MDHHDARNRAIDRLRREASRADRHAQAALVHVREQPRDEGPVQDDPLRLIFTCCHPALAMGAKVALTLRLLGGLMTAEIARARCSDTTGPGATAGGRRAEVHGPAAALALIEDLKLERYHLFYAIR
jgi:predicted RNA polymerase sigma factor